MTDTTPMNTNDFNDNRNIHSFIVRIWLEMSGGERDHEIWRGHIIHLPSYKRHYFSDLNEITMFIASHLKDQT